MSELIDRQAVLDALSNAVPSLTTPDGCGQFDRELQIVGEALVDAMQIVHALPTASPWRRVEEELPEQHKNVLCMGRKGGCFVGWSIDNADTVKANGYGRAYVHGGNARSFTHWMPIPEPPKEDE